MNVTLDGERLTPAALHAIAHGAAVRVAPEARTRAADAARRFRELAAHDTLRQKWAWLVGGDAPHGVVRAFLLGHCGGVGAPMPREIVRATMAARANVLLTGATGARPEVIDALVAWLDADAVPVVPSQGSTGAAGSPALAHVARAMCGWGGSVDVKGRRVSAADVGLPRLELDEKDALSLINGDTPTAAMAALACVRARRLLDTAEAACALTFEVVRADLDCLFAPALEARRHGGAVKVAERLHVQLAGTELCAEGRTPDAFSIRCAPQVLGAAWDALMSVEMTVRRELNGAVDNPLLVAGRVVESGNFHGAPLALAMDHLKVALSQVAGIAERRVFRLTYGQLSGLPSFLVPGTGLNSGLMLAQYTAASLVSETKGLAHPASVDSVPTVQHREDHVPMGTIAARGALRIAEMVADVLAIELLCAAQGLDFRLAGEAVDADGRLVAVMPRKSGIGTARTHALVRERVPRWVEDRVLHPDLVALGRAVREGVFTGSDGPW